MQEKKLAIPFDFLKHCFGIRDLKALFGLQAEEQGLECTKLVLAFMHPVRSPEAEQLA